MPLRHRVNAIRYWIQYENVFLRNIVRPEYRKLGSAYPPKKFVSAVQRALVTNFFNWVRHGSGSSP